ncbi:Crp/Fnr family transcriptional regulator [Sulfurospirillum arsenophilum]|uniref:Crp/Fnr family transcriptional regulator n=1 Tax=Sulfurospirillum arsenophilum TaxID=56698 RepID=UPI0005A806D8|nr:Crp/Fnr family transcriptional regulator [Sulfurospirillum arsenophilum]
MKRFSFFEKLSRANQELLQSHSTRVRIPKGTILFEQGDQCKEILFLIEGSIRVYRRHESGQEITLYYLKPLEQCNVNTNSAFSGLPAVGTAVSESELAGLMIPAHICHQIYIQEQAYQNYVFSLFTERLEGLVALVEDVRFKRLDERLLEWFQKSKEKTITVTHEQLASHLGTSREVISRLLKTFEKEGIVALSRGKITYLHEKEKSGLLKWFSF